MIRSVSWRYMPVSYTHLDVYKRQGVPSIMNPDDKGALEQALQFKDRFGAEVDVITMGPPQAKAVLYEAFGMGCDKGFLITDRKFGGADTLATSYTISHAIKSLEPVSYTHLSRRTHPLSLCRDSWCRWKSSAASQCGGGASSGGECTLQWSSILSSIRDGCYGKGA